MTPDFLQRGRILIVAAHPDDETIGMGGQLGLPEDPYIVHVTDGAPRATPSRIRYAALRRREFEAAMVLAGIERDRCLELGAIDQESSFGLSHLTRLLCGRLKEIRPQVVLTHAYEGGHPDHDACAFIVQAAVYLLKRRGIELPLRAEFTSYHNGSPHSVSSAMVAGAFLPGPPETTVSLPAAAQSRKRRMLDCFGSQEQVLREFPISEERFRVAPEYDFLEAPHSGNLYYEDKNWGLSGRQWRYLALLAARDLRYAKLADKTCVT